MHLALPHDAHEGCSTIWQSTHPALQLGLDKHCTQMASVVLAGLVGGGPHVRAPHDVKQPHLVLVGFRYLQSPGFAHGGGMQVSISFLQSSTVTVVAGGFVAPHVGVLVLHVLSAPHHSMTEVQTVPVHVEHFMPHVEAVHWPPKGGLVAVTAVAVSTVLTGMVVSTWRIGHKQPVWHMHRSGCGGPRVPRLAGMQPSSFGQFCIDMRRSRRMSHPIPKAQWRHEGPNALSDASKEYPSGTTTLALK
jgi:hypothetical protein